MQQTPIHEIHNEQLLQLIPKESNRIIEIGCSSGVLAKEFKKINPECFYLGVEIDLEYTKRAERYCDECLTLNIEEADEVFWINQKDKDCWIFADVLEHLKNPWEVLRKIHNVLPKNGVVVACIPNIQHWSIQVKLSIGDFRYESMGLLDKTHLRWFTRQTIFEMFDETGYHITSAIGRNFHEPTNEKFLPVIRQMATMCGADPDQAEADARPLQYVVVAQKK